MGRPLSQWERVSGGLIPRTRDENRQWLIDHLPKALEWATEYARHPGYSSGPFMYWKAVDAGFGMETRRDARKFLDWLKSHSGSRSNPFNATKPAEWATMSKKLRKSWNRRHWRPDQWKCDLALKKEATRLANRSTRAGRGLLALAERMVEPEDATNPGPSRTVLRRELVKLPARLGYSERMVCRGCGQKIGRKHLKACAYGALVPRPGGGYYGGVQNMRRNPTRQQTLGRARAIVENSVFLARGVWGYQDARRGKGRSEAELRALYRRLAKH